MGINRRFGWCWKDASGMEPGSKMGVEYQTDIFFCDMSGVKSRASVYNFYFRHLGFTMDLKTHCLL